MKPILSVRNLSIDYVTDSGAQHAVVDVGFDLLPGRSLALVGESGCGKTTTMLALMRLLPESGRIVGGQVNYQGRDLLTLTENEMRAVRWDEIAVVFQSAMNALNPVRRIDSQLIEAMMLHRTVYDEIDARARMNELMERVGIPPERAAQYPHQFSGGMRQRVMIAMALACKPSVLIADEPTTALDVMVQAQILDLLAQLQADLGLSVILVTHDLGVVAEVCDDVLIMYGGKVAEYGDVDTIFNAPQHPYTQRLLQTFPNIGDPYSPIISIPGYPPSLSNLPSGCRFEPRCHLKTGLCAHLDPALREVKPGHRVACHYAEELEVRL